MAPKKAFVTIKRNKKSFKAIEKTGISFEDEDIIDSVLKLGTPFFSQKQVTKAQRMKASIDKKRGE